MGRKIFVSYKYGDGQVLALPGNPWDTTARHYVSELQARLDRDDHINKGEQDGQSLADFSDDTIASKLRDRIYDSSLTIVLISPGMKTAESETEQWIPWEVSYSLRTKTRNDRTSGPNALLGIVLPDRTGDYRYFIQDESCPHCKSRTINTHTTFDILKRNSFNVKKPEYADCADHAGGGKVYLGRPSYIQYVKWGDFHQAPTDYLAAAYSAQENIDGYNISVPVRL